ncbi:MAG: hypothetical protein JRI34_04330 [Deltaproteobacteria bacterium]|nr:hypothetical protein [Deltaproteobacteria bacterium]
MIQHLPPKETAGVNSPTMTGPDPYFPKLQQKVDLPLTPTVKGLILVETKKPDEWGI